MRHSEVDGVKVGHHEGRLEEIVETDYHWQDHVGNIDISEKNQGYQSPDLHESPDLLVVKNMIR